MNEDIFIEYCGDEAVYLSVETEKFYSNRMKPTSTLAAMRKGITKLRSGLVGRDIVVASIENNDVRVLKIINSEINGIEASDGEFYHTSSTFFIIVKKGETVEDAIGLIDRDVLAGAHRVQKELDVLNIARENLNEKTDVISSEFYDLRLKLFDTTTNRHGDESG